jgi:hypothetical protein
MPEPDYKRPFEQTDFRGYFRWSQSLTKQLGGSLYHACHEDELTEILDAGKLGLRSKWKIELPEHGLWSAPGTWTGLNYFYNGNHYGPLLIEFPLTVLDDRHFMVFRRTESRHRYFFVQYEAQIPIYSFGTKQSSKEPWRRVKPGAYFDESGEQLSMKRGAIYDIVITAPISLTHAEFSGVSHPKCIPGKCSGLSSTKSHKLLSQIAIDKFKAEMLQNEHYLRMIKRFPLLAGQTVELPNPDLL